jgi:hypothetical protein
MRVLALVGVPKGKMRLCRWIWVGDMVVFGDDLCQIVHFFFVQLLGLNYVLGDVLFSLEAINLVVGKVL